jgi:hypothetical protein
MRPEDLATDLGMSGKTLRGWLREQFPRGENERGTNWYLTHAQVLMARTKFGPILGLAGRRSSPALPAAERMLLGVRREGTAPEATAKATEDIVQ